MTNIREVAYDTLLDYEKNNSSYVPIKEVLDKYSYLEKTERSFLQRLMEGVIERKITIDYFLDKISKIPTAKQKPPVRIILRMGAYQILYMDNVPDSAAVNEAVKLAKKRNLSNLAGVINAVLRNVTKLKDNLEWPNKETDVIKYLSVFYSCPEWIVSLLVKEQGEEKAGYVLENSVSVRPITGRVNLSKASRDEVVCMCNSCARKSEIIESAIVFNKVDNIADIPAVRDGLVCIQDISSMMVGYLAGIKQDDTVLDLCASPGGKTLQAADIAECGKVISCDLTERKTQRIEENVNRCGFENIDIKVNDATVHNDDFEEIADVIIADVPCSGLGVMGRKNDIKYNLNPEQIEELCEISKKILTNAVRYLKSGGTLMFSTCTVSKKENDDTVAFIRETLGLKSVSFYDELPKALKCDSARDGFIQLYGKDGQTDGFFIAKFTKQ